MIERWNRLIKPEYGELGWQDYRSDPDCGFDAKEKLTPFGVFTFFIYKTFQGDALRFPK
tara:strand:- start:67747 stop:67923 length:177 start_codon:yes stop_codon:yes gene_type:complete